MNGRLFIVVAALFALTACAPTGTKPAYMPGSAQDNAATQPTALPTDEPVVTATPAVAMSVAQSMQRDESTNRVEPGLGVVLAALGVIGGIPAFWVISLGALRRAKGTL
jgi:predicted small lipoprotein YifL